MGNKKRKNIIVLNNAFHGRTVTGIQAGYNQSHREGFLRERKIVIVDLVDYQ